MDRISKDFTALDGGDPFGVSDVRTVVQELTEAFNDLTMSLRKPNIMLIGKTGAGKSSLVNAVFGVKFADTGTGEPVTKHLARYAPEGKSVIVYDTKGLEHGNHEQFINDTEGFLSSLRASSDLRDHLHVIWYVLDMAHSRFQEFEAKICRNVLAKIPLCFVLNKADTATAEQLRTIRSFIEEQGLENCKGIFEVVSDRKNYSPEYCPHCKGDNFRFKQRTKELICDNPNCNRTTTIGPTSGLESLVKETIHQLPELARHSFVEAQQVTEKERILIAKEAIILCANAIRHNKSHMATHPARLIVNMATRLAFLWGFRFFPSIVTQEIAYQYFKNHNMQSFAARLAKMLVELFSEKMLSQALSIATGVEMCRLFIEIRMKAIGMAIKADGPLPDHLESCFSLSISDETLAEVTNDLRIHPLDVVVTNLLTRRVDAILVGTAGVGSICSIGSSGAFGSGSSSSPSSSFSSSANSIFPPASSSSPSSSFSFTPGIPAMTPTPSPPPIFPSSLFTPTPTPTLLSFPPTPSLLPTPTPTSTAFVFFPPTSTPFPSSTSPGLTPATTPLPPLHTPHTTKNVIS